MGRTDPPLGGDGGKRLMMLLRSVPRDLVEEIRAVAARFDQLHGPPKARQRR